MTSNASSAQGMALEKRGKAAGYGLLVMIILAAASCLSTAGELAFLSNAAAGRVVTAEQGQTIDLRQGLVGVLYFIGLVTTGILFIRWQRTAYDVTISITTGAIPHAKPWTIWGWIVPVLCFFVPYRIVKAIYACATRNTSPSLVGWWWFFWIAGNATSVYSVRIGAGDSLDALVASSGAGLTGDLLRVPAAIIAFKIIADVNSGMQRQHVLLASVEEAGRRSW